MIDLNIKILAIDDSSTMRRIIVNSLSALGLQQTTTANCGADALTLIGCTRFDLIISDWHMEPIDGIELLQKIRADKNSHNIPFIVLSAESDKNSIVKIRDSGASDYIIKPFNKFILKRKLQNIFGSFPS
jgi:two-component system chemotaxis response regulator CheY